MTGSKSMPRSHRLSVGIFEDATRLELALREVERFADFQLRECSLLARRRGLEDALQARLEPLAPAADGSRRYAVTGGRTRAYPCIHRNLLGTLIEVAADGGLGPVLASSGRLAEIIAAAEAMAEALLEPWLPAGDAARLQARLDAGSLLLWIPVQDSDAELRACRLLLKYSRRAVSAHDIRV